ncbi:hypothetical protein DFH08DRAFT_825282 [Mycena albidolilacea]|uniref:CxC2-like cysteine cluster KDZ transposase-associated domain-containing protein n=1 Tax=Mycena albidolilacea TaxID=1033008 RepID=A0AAD6Z2L6_9AGAR|nr:hypothetical protein DFH08DRAFT_825282 [Mycena albidolilacea]
MLCAETWGPCGATAKDPGTAFTFSVLKEFSLHNLESKKAAYDYLGALSRLTDNAFTADVPVSCMGSIKSFCIVQWEISCHCNQSQRTLDGNFQCNQYNKNTDPDDISLCAGKGYFPPDDEYKAYLAKIPVSREVVNKQDKKKFKNMAITGTVNCQCRHVFILSSVDLHHGERFANTDAALAHDVRQHKPRKDYEVTLRFEIDDIDKVTTYDIASRFQEHFPDLVDDIRSMRWGVPSLHVQGHQDSCNYLFGTAYMECVGHFHGETVEHYWPEANQLGPHPKAANLAKDLALAKARYIEKRDHFIGLSVSFRDRLDDWNALDRTSSKNEREADSVYRHRTTKVWLSSFTYHQGLIGCRRQLCAANAAHTEHSLDSTRREISSRRTKLGNMIAAWRKQQKSITPKLGDKVSGQATASPVVPVEFEVLFLPSDLTSMERLELDVAALGAEEVQWREGQAFDALHAVQNVVKALRALRDRKGKNDRQQKDNTRAGAQIADTTKRRDRHMQTYEAARQAMIRLGALTDGPNAHYPRLTEADTFMKSVRQTRQVGDSRFTDGLLWRVSGGISASLSNITPPISTGRDTTTAGG